MNWKLTANTLVKVFTEQLSVLLKIFLKKQAWYMSSLCVSFSPENCLSLYVVLFPLRRRQQKKSKHWRSGRAGKIDKDKRDQNVYQSFTSPYMPSASIYYSFNLFCNDHKLSLSGSINPSCRHQLNEWKSNHKAHAFVSWNGDEFEWRWNWILCSDIMHVICSERFIIQENN